MEESLRPELIDKLNTEQEIGALPTEPKIKMIAHSDPCTALSFNTLGDTLATGGADKMVKLWSIKGKKIHETCSLKGKTHSNQMTLAQQVSEAFHSARSYLRHMLGFKN